MHLNMTWHVDGKLSLKHLFPQNSGGVELVDERGLSLQLYLPSDQWWMLYCNLPKAKGFFVTRKVGDGAETVSNPAEISEFLLSLLEKRFG